MNCEKQNFWSSLEPWQRKEVVKGLSLFVAAVSFSAGIESRDESPVVSGADVAQVSEWTPAPAELSTPDIKGIPLVQPHLEHGRGPVYKDESQ